MRESEKIRAVAAESLEWWFVDRLSIFGVKAAGLEPSSAVVWNSQRVDSMHERRINLSGLSGSSPSHPVAKERRIGEVITRMEAMDLHVARARWESLGGDATLATLAFQYRTERGSYLGIALEMGLCPAQPPATPLETMKRFAASSRSRIPPIRDAARSLWLRAVDRYAEVWTGIRSGGAIAGG